MDGLQEQVSAQRVSKQGTFVYVVFIKVVLEMLDFKY